MTNYGNDTCNTISRKGFTMKRWMFLFLAIALVVILSACGGGGNEGTEEDQQQDNQDTSDQQSEQTSGNMDDEADTNDAAEGEVVVSLIDADDEVTATATLTEGDSGVDIALEGQNLPPGEHGFHIHETGACESPDFESAGSHYNPTDANHGFNDPEGPHAGDLKNIEVAEDGTVDTEVTADMVTLEQGQNNTLFPEGGTAIVIHSEADDYESQPSGDAGNRIACGVIGE